MNYSQGFIRQLLLFILAIAVAPSCLALEIEPRKWGHLPMDKNFGGLQYLHTDADIFIDPTYLLDDVEMKLDALAGGYIRTFELFDKSARIEIKQAYLEGKWTGSVDGEQTTVSRNGWSDTIVRVAMNLYGAPPLRGKEFSAYRSTRKVETTAGVALAVRLPTGHYLEDKLINLGQNRFTFRPQLGFMHTRGKWITELTGEVAFHTENDEFFNGNTLEQKPLYIVHGHLIRTFTPGHWASISMGYDYGGEFIVNGVDKDDTKQNIGWKLSYAYPVNKAAGFKFSYLGTRSQETTGFDSDSLAAGMSFAW